MSCQVEWGPLLNSPCEVYVELLHSFFPQLLIHLDYSFYSLVLALSDSKMQRRPIVVVLNIYLSTTHYEDLCDISTFFGVFREYVHYLVEGSVSITVYLIYIGILLNERANDPNF